MTEPATRHEHAEPVDPAMPVCLQCLTPHSPLQHYCEKCGETVGQLSPYIPFISIRYDYAGFRKMWQRLWHEQDVSLGSKVACAVMIVMFAPLMLIGLPLVLLARRDGRNRDPEFSSREHRR